MNFFAGDNMVGYETRINSTTDDDQKWPIIEVLSDGGYVIVRNSVDQDGDGNGVFLKQFDENGDLVTTP